MLHIFRFSLFFCAGEKAPGRRLFRWFAFFCLLLALPRPGGAAEIIDDSGRAVRLAVPARRIIPLYAGLSETLLALGLEDRIVARTVSDDILSPSLPVVGTHMRPNPELIAGLKPDLVVQLEGREEAGQAAEILQRMGISVARFRIASFADLYSCIERLGVLSGEEAAAEALTASLRERLARIEARTPGNARRPRIFFEVRYPNLLGAGGGSMVQDVIRAAGGENCLADFAERMVRLGEEALVLRNPDIYLVQQGAMNKAPVPVDSRDHFRTLAAVRTGFVRVVPESLYSRTSPRSIDAVEDLAAYIDLWRAAPSPPAP